MLYQLGRRYPLRKPKTLRRRCASDACRKLYRHADPRSKTCSQPCKQRLYRQRKKAAALAEQERRARVADIMAGMNAARKTAAAPGPTAPHPTAPPPTPTPAPPRYSPSRSPVDAGEREVVEITIRQPTTFPGTPIRRG